MTKKKDDERKMVSQKTNEKRLFEQIITTKQLIHWSTVSKHVKSADADFTV